MFVKPKSASEVKTMLKGEKFVKNLLKRKRVTKRNFFFAEL